MFHHSHIGVENQLKVRGVVPSPFTFCLVSQRDLSSATPTTMMIGDRL